MAAGRWSLVAVAVALRVAAAVAASDQRGQVLFNGLPVPGATITAVQGEKKIVAVSDDEGAYRLSGLDDGAYSLRVEMLGFEPIVQELKVAENNPPSTWTLTLLSFDEISKVATFAADAASADRPGTSPRAAAASAREGASASADNPTPAEMPAETPDAAA